MLLTGAVERLGSLGKAKDSENWKNYMNKRLPRTKKSRQLVQSKSFKPYYSFMQSCAKSLEPTSVKRRATANSNKTAPVQKLRVHKATLVALNTSKRFTCPLPKVPLHRTMIIGP